MYQNAASASPRQTLAQKNPDNVIRGLKAAIHNPNVSEAGKQHAVEQLNEMGVSVDDETKSSAPLGRHSVITTRTMVHESGRTPICLGIIARILTSDSHSIYRICAWRFGKRCP